MMELHFHMHLEILKDAKYTFERYIIMHSVFVTAIISHVLQSDCNS